jgi:hypothetical protein
MSDVKEPEDLLLRLRRVYPRNDLTDEAAAEIAALRAEVARLTAERDAALAGAVTVKPLEWLAGDGKTSSEDCYTALDGFGGKYTVMEGQLWHDLAGWFTYESDDAAKAAAQADYEARTRAPLIPAIALLTKE